MYRGQHNGNNKHLVEEERKHLEEVEKFIHRLEEQHKEGPNTPVTPSSSYHTPVDFWKEMSPQLSYIDGSSVSSFGHNVSGSFRVSPRAPRSMDTLDYSDALNDNEDVPSLPSLTPLARHASDSLCTGSNVTKSQTLGLPGHLSIPDALEIPGLTGVLKKKHGSLDTSSNALDGSPRENIDPSTQMVVRVQKTKIQKRLSFGDTLDLQTTIYTPAEDRDGYYNKNHFEGSLTNGSTNSLEKGLSEEYINCVPPLVRRKSLDSQSQYSYYMDKDLRYYFQHPWLRLIVAYLVIFCNFLLFAEDPVSHSHTESNIPVVGNVFSFVATKYPTEWYWRMIKVIMWLIAILCGMLVGKVLIHGIFLKRLLRLKMFRDDQGSWMTMLLTVIVSLYMFSYVYNLILLIGHREYYIWKISSAMYITNENMMKAAATCTWLGDLITALMVTDMMLQDNLYPHWATSFRNLYRLSNVPRILIFWCGSIVVATLVIFLIVSDYISWDKLNKGFVETTELSRAFLASFILVMDLLIVMQDWDFPHFTSTIDVNLPGFYTHTLHWRYAETKITGKWFNYGIIFLVMIFDLNMWKNQIFYAPEDYGQYIDPVSRKVFTVEDESVLVLGNSTLVTWEARGDVDIETGSPYRDDDMFMYSRYMGYELKVKCTAFIPSILGFVMFFTLVTLYGRFPPNQDGTYGGRLKLRKRSSWRRERRSNGDLCTRERCSSTTGSTAASSETESAQQKTVKGKCKENATDL